MGAAGPEDVAVLPPVLPEILPQDFVADARVVMLIVIDGLGALALDEADQRGDVPGLASAQVRDTLTSVFPPTTAAATTSLQYGIAPGTHGMAGYTLYLREIDAVFNMITWRPAGNGDDGEVPLPETFLQGPHIFARFEEAGIDPVIVSNALFETSPLTRAQASSVRYRGYRTLAEFSRRLLREVERPGRRFVFGYWDGYDALGHTWGPDTDVARLEVRLIDRAFWEGVLQPLAERGEDVAVLVTADHGHIPIPRERRIALGRAPGLLRSLSRRPTGEPRQLGLTFREGRSVGLAKLGEDAVGLDLVAAINAGLYGPEPFHADLATRTGELLLLARGSAAFEFPGGTTGSLGGHGSLTPHEMLVPLLGWRFPKSQAMAL